MKTARVLLSLASIFILANWGTEESNVAGRKRPSVSFYGSLLTYDNDKEYKVEDITISRSYKQIEMYDIPSKKNTTTYTLENDPTQGIKTFIDLSEVSEIQIPKLEMPWTYQKDKNDRLVKYVEIKVISKDTPKTANTYLIGADKKIICKEVNATGPEKDFPISSVKLIKIDGFEHRDGGKPKDCPEKK